MKQQKMMLLVEEYRVEKLMNPYLLVFWKYWLMLRGSNHDDTKLKELTSYEQISHDDQVNRIKAYIIVRDSTA